MPPTEDRRGRTLARRGGRVRPRPSRAAVPLGTAARACLILASLLSACLGPSTATASDAPRWNVLFLFADDWGRYASCYAAADRAAGVERPGLCDVVKTPHVDRLAREGVLFRHAFVDAPSCTPCRSALLSGRAFFRCGLGAILQGARWDDSIPSWPLALSRAGYSIGKCGKVWSPGTPVDAPFGGQTHAFERAGMRAMNWSESATALVEAGRDAETAHALLADEVAANFDAFLDAVPPGTPWHYWAGTTTTHRSWVAGSGRRLWGIDPDTLTGRLPAALPDVPEVREDIADYLGEVQAVDRTLGALLARLEARGELDRTLVVAAGDHGIPGVPRGKCNLHDLGTRVTLVARVPGGAGGRVLDDFVTLADLAPTFTEIGGTSLPAPLHGRSLLGQLTSPASGRVDPTRRAVVLGRERHVADARPGRLPYPSRALRTDDWLYVRNFAPERWPMGQPAPGDDDATIERALPDEVARDTRAAFADMDAGPTKAWLVAHRDEPEARPFRERAFGKRPAEELYDLRADPEQLVNLAGDARHAATREALAADLLERLRRAGDPRLDDDPPFDRGPFTDPAPGRSSAALR